MHFGSILKNVLEYICDYRRQIIRFSRGEWKQNTGAFFKPVPHVCKHMGDLRYRNFGICLC